MSFQIDKAFVQMYGSTIAHLVQQKGSRLRSAVRVEKLKQIRPQGRGPPAYA